MNLTISVTWTTAIAFFGFSFLAKDTFPFTASVSGIIALLFAIYGTLFVHKNSNARIRSYESPARRRVKEKSEKEIQEWQADKHNF